MFTVQAYSENVNAGGVFNAITPVQDSSATVGQNGFIVNEKFRFIFGAIACVGNNAAARARIIAPSLRPLGYPEIAPVSLALVPTVQSESTIYPQAMIGLIPSEQVSIEQNATPGAAEQVSAAIFLADGPLAGVSGEMLHIPFSWTATLVAGGYTSAIPALDDALPQGVYAIVGSRLVVAAGVIHRYILPNDKHRPGAPCVANTASLDVYHWRHGALGEWGTFTNVELPQIEVLGSAVVANATYRGVMDLIKVS